MAMINPMLTVNINMDDPGVRGLVVATLEFIKKRACLEVEQIEQELSFRKKEHEVWLQKVEMEMEKERLK